jgi:hypothetical protein
VARDEPGRALALECEEAGLQRGLMMFMALLRFVHARDGYDPIAGKYL